MQPLGEHTRHQNDLDSRVASARLEEGRVSSGGRQLPRFIRRAIRMSRGLTAERVLRSRASLLVALSAALAIGGGYYVKNAGPDSLLASATTSLGFNAGKLVVNGNRNLDLNVLQARLGPYLGQSLFGFEVDEAREEILNDPWVKSATVRKVYPDTIVVDVIERQAVALWKSNDKVNLISRDGFVIGEAELHQMRLPQVVGNGANMAAAEFLSVISRFPNLSERSSAYIRVGGRRWDVLFSNGLRVLLPEDDWKLALSELQNLHDSKQMLERDLVQIDMRLPDRLVLKMEPEAAEIRKTAIQKSLERDWHKI